MKLIKIKPKEYLEQGMRYCGGYTIKAILSAYKLDDGRKPNEYLPSLKKSLGFTTPKIIQRVLKTYRINSQIKNADKLSDKEKIELIKNEINKNHPVVILIGNGYSKKGKYSWLQRQLIAHWISVWGYNDKEKVFYIYDSFAHKKENIPIGNVKRTYSQVLRDWNGAFYTKSYLYIKIKKN